MAKLIGTAGHVDHGKTSLIRVLTGINTDRLPEEQKRGLTIDLGYAYVDLPSHGQVSIVDVPGHEKFLTNMLVGALGIDVGLLCIAADEGVKPQTVEHLQILDLLPVEHLVVALTRADLADAELRELVALEVSELLEGTRFAGSSVVAVSAVTGAGLAELVAGLDEALSMAKCLPRQGAWYLPIDRVFTVRGHGCVVTGTMARGTVSAGESAQILPGNREVRVRSVQIHGEDAISSEEGKRTALNLVGVKAEQVHRGMMIGGAGAIFETQALDAEVRWLVVPKHGLRVRVSVGAEEVIGRVFLSDAESSLCQLRLESEVAVARDQALIVRRYSPPDLLGGGRVLVPVAEVRRRSQRGVVSANGSPGESVVALLGDDPNGVDTDAICKRMGSSRQELGTEFEKLQDAGKVRGFAGIWLSEAGYQVCKERFLEGLERALSAAPGKIGVPREAAVSKAGLQWSGKPLDRLISMLVKEGAIEAFGTTVRTIGHQIQLPPRQRQLLDRVIQELRSESVNVPTPHDIARSLGIPKQAIDEILVVGHQAGEIVPLEEAVFYTKPQLEAIRARINEEFGDSGFTTGEARDRLQTTRKYIIPLLEHFDSVRFTTRIGDKRKINRT